MKGPFERLKYDLRRLWECPLCNRRERSDGTVTSRFCSCPGKGVPEGQRTAMKLLEEAGHRTVPEFTYQPGSDSLSDEIPVVIVADAQPAPETNSVYPEPAQSVEQCADAPEA